jgi:hypothetical protein
MGMYTQLFLKCQVNVKHEAVGEFMPVIQYLFGTGEFPEPDTCLSIQI